MDDARVVITGLGAVSPLGLSVAEMWDGLRAGRCGIRRIGAFDPTGFPCELAGETPDYRIQNFIPKSHRKAAKLMCRDIELAVIAACEAVISGGVTTKGVDPDTVDVDVTRAAVIIGAGMISCELDELGPAVAAGTADGRFDLRKWGRDGIELVTPLWLLKYLPNMLACHIGIIHDLQGPSNTITCAEASAHLSIAEAAQVLARGDSDVALAGGAEAKVNPLMLVRQTLLRRTAVGCNDSPEAACRPFDARATGSVFGEGGGIVMLERLDHARDRNATILAEVAGVGHSHSLNPAYEDLDPDGTGLRLAVEQALDDAGIRAAELDLLVPHGTGIPRDDSAEAKALQDVLGSAVTQVPVWPTKSMLSTTGAAAGALDVIAAVQAMQTGQIPPARNFETPADGCALNVVTEPLERRITYALSCSYTYGGQTAALVLRRFDEERA
jgi:3-oxoacyl-[acyl-carrier-protein] synthase II